MKIAVFGAGGVGGYFGARLAEAGHDVHFIARGRHGEAMRARGLRVETASGAIHLARPEVTDDPAAVGPCDFVLFCVKLWDTATAAEACRPLLGPETAVISLQNGVEAEAVLADTLGPRHVMGGVCQISASIAEPGVIRQVGDFARLVVGELDGADSARLRRIAGALDGPGVEVKASLEIEVDIWRKFVLLAPFAGATAFHREPIGAIRASADKRGRFEALVEEALAVGRARGVALPPETKAQTMAFVERAPAEMKASMLVDLERGNPLELAWLTGAVVKLGQAAGVDVPVSRAVCDALEPYAEGRAA